MEAGHAREAGEPVGDALRRHPGHEHLEDGAGVFGFVYEPAVVHYRDEFARLGPNAVIDVIEIVLDADLSPDAVFHRS